MNEVISIRGAREHNLQDISLDIPKNKLTVCTGVSGSGKSSLVFSTVYAEAQRQLLDTFSAYTRSRMPKIPRPKVEEIRNLPVAIVIDQKRLGRNRSSTVGTVTEIHSYLRLLYSRCGHPQIGDSMNFSFNRPEGMCPDCTGSGRTLQLNEDALLDWEKSLAGGGIRHPRFKLGGFILQSILSSGLFDIHKPLKDFSREELDTLFYSEKMKPKTTPPEGIRLTFGGIVHSFKPEANRRDVTNEDDATDDPKNRRYYDLQLCPRCRGQRLNPRALSVKVGGKNITELCAMELTGLNAFLRDLPVDPEVPDSFRKMYREISRSIILRICNRLEHLINIGVGYLSLDRETGTLSGGESQRVKMARQLDCDLNGLLYILDEPSIGLHPSDIDNLIGILRELRDKGNTVLVIEHDGEMITAADHIIDIGPTGGSNGGRLLFQGSVPELLLSETPTGRQLCSRGVAASRLRTPSGSFPVRKASRNNLKDLDIDIPAGVLVCVTGVAGSGKSTLINDVFTEQFPGAVIIDQSAVSRSRRSTPASYTKVLDLIRKEFARVTGRDPGLFSFNSTGRCPECKGLGEQEMEMHFLESVSVTCDSCKGRRFRPDVLELTFQGKSIADVFEMTVDQARDFFTHKEIRRRLKILSDVGLGYLRLGQNLGQLSGGEAQRVKLGSELRKKGKTYIMDEPTTGLHMADIERLAALVHRLVDAGNSVIIIEHNLDIIAQADWIIDMGPAGGSRGGQIIANGPPEEICRTEASLTGRYLKEYREGDDAASA